MKPLKMQPTFTLELPTSVDETVARIHDAIDSTDLSEHVARAGRCLDYQIPGEDQRFWSPHLSVQVSETDSGSQIFGRFSPRPEIWTMFMAVYAIVVIAMFAAAIFAYVQWFLAGHAWALVILPIGLCVIASLHAASLVGQSWSTDQMELLRNRLEDTLSVAFPNERE